ncbi:MAG: twin-arginine translocase subunit TatC [Gemmataceae bacterium]|nr:twin-arginine translocase subunit TatC [Gemmataceae bacterium]
MPPRDPQHPDPDDFFSESRMTFGEHIEDLRTHLMRAIKGFLLAVLISFFIGKQVLAFIAAPVEKQLGKFYDRRVQRVAEELKAKDPDIARKNEPQNLELLFPRDQLEERLHIKVGPKSPGLTEDGKFVRLTIQFRPVELELATSEARKLVGRRPVLTTLSVQEAFVVYFKVSLMTGFVLASPWIFYQVWSFIAAGLYPHEKRYVNVFLPFSLGLFIGGVLICEFFVMPAAVDALLWFNEWLDLEPDLRLNEWLGFAIWMPVIFGLSFQTPLVMLFLERIGIYDVAAFRSKRRMVWFLMAVFAAIITPSTDPYSMLFLWTPMCLLYELGIWLCWFSPSRRPFELDVPEPEEMVEV